MVIKFYGAVGSTATLRVQAFIPIDMSKKEHKKPEFLARNVRKY